MSLHIALATGALLAALVLMLTSGSRALAGLAVAAAALELATATGVLQLTRLHAAQVPLGLVLPILLAVPGLLAWLRATSRPAVSAAAIVAFVGTTQVVLYLTSHP
jgi:hypothetical protein